MFFFRKGKTIRKALQEFFNQDPMEFPIVSRSFLTIEAPNIQRGLDRVIQETGAKSSEIGYSSHMGFMMTLSDLLSEGGYSGAVVGPVSYADVQVSHSEWLPCINFGFVLITMGNKRIAVLIRQSRTGRGLVVEAISPLKEDAVDFLRSVSAAAQESNVYRGKVISLEVANDGCSAPEIRFHALPQVENDDIVLPDETLRILRRNTVGFFEQSEVLFRAGRSAKRGILIFGKPGTGKTLTSRWLAQSIPGITVLLMSGEQLWLVKECCQIARMLAPSLVIMEDVDLIATQRGEDRHPMYQVTLHQLLNEMDGIDTESAVLFLMTTNKTEAIEPALASRPGRIDQAIEYPLPDAACRHRLFELYGQGLNIDVAGLGDIVRRTEGASPAFIRELLRKALMFAASDSDSPTPTITEQNIRDAMQELVVSGGSITRSLLGFEETDTIT